MSEPQAADTPVQEAVPEAPPVQAGTNNTPDQNAPTTSNDAETGTTTTTEDDTAAIRAQVEREHALADAQKRLKELEGDVAKAKSEKAAVEGERDSAAQATNQLRTQLSSLQSTHHESTSELSVLRTRIEIIEREKKELFEETERLQERSSRGSQELYTLRTQKSEAAQKIAHLDVEVSEQRMAAESAKFNEQRSIQTLEAARTENLRLGKTYTDLEERFGKYRAEKQSHLSSLQTEHDLLLARVTTAESSYQALQRSYNDQANRLASAFADISNLTSSAASRKAASQSESYRLADENRVLERRAEEARSTIAEREAELERLVSTHDIQTKDWETKWKSEERRRREAEKRAEELRAVVDRIALASGEGTDLSPAAALAGEMRGSGKSYTQFFTEYTVQEGRLKSAESEIERLTELLDEIGNDIAEKKPLLDEQAAEHAAAIDRANALAAELSTVMTTRDGLEEVVRSMKAAASHHTEEVSSLQSTADDLSRQVQNLIRQLAIRDDPSLANVDINGGSVKDTGDVITDHLLEFRSLRGLQENNQKLLKLTRALMARLDQREIRRATADDDDVNTGETLDQATETIEKLHRQLLDANKKINEATRERDFFSKLLARGEGLKWNGSAAGGLGGPLDDEGPAPHQQTIEMLRGEIEGVRVKAEEEVRGLKVQLRSKEEAVGSAEIAKARAEAKVSMLEEQTRSLTDANNLQKQRGEGLESQIRQIQSSISSAQNEARMALEQVALRQAEAERLRMDVAMARAEKEQWAGTEARLQSDFRSVQSERAKLQQLIENYTNVSAESERSRGEERKKLEKRIDELTRETTALRSQIDQTREATRAAEQKVAAADTALEAAVSSIRKEKEASDALATSRQTQIEQLQADLARSKEAEAAKTRIGLTHQRHHNAAKAELSAAAAASTEALAAKDREIGEIKGKLDEAEKAGQDVRGKMADVERRLADVTRSESLKEGTVQRLQTELTAARAAKGGVDSAAVDAMKSERDTLQTRVSELEKEVEAMKAELVQKQEESDKRYEENVTRVNRANTGMRTRIADLLAEKNEALTRVASLEEKLADAQIAAGGSGKVGEETGSGEGTVDQTKIDEAVKAAVAAKEAELEAAIEAAKLSATATPVATGETPSADNTAAIEAAVKAKEAELTSTIESRINEAIATQKSELEAEQAKLKAETEELLAKIKALERQHKTAEMTRKTLERQKEVAEAKVKRLEGEAAGGSARAAAPEGTPTPAATGVAPAAAGLAAVPTAPAGPSIRGTAVRGRGRGAARGAAPPRNSILQNVNATLSAAAPSPTSATTAIKRPAPEEGEIADGAAPEGSTNTGAAPHSGDVLAQLRSGGLGPRGRTIKRPRGAGPARGGGMAGREGAAETTGESQDAGAGASASTEGSASAPSGGEGNPGAGSGTGASEGS